MNEDELKVIEKLKSILKEGDKVGCTRCPGTKRVFIFKEWYGQWMVSKTGIYEFHPINVYSINGVPFEK